MTPEGLAQLISRVALRERTAFDALYTATATKLFGVCLRILNNRGDAEDALQDVYIKIWNKADRFAVSEVSPVSWLVAVARNHSIDVLRSRRQPTRDIDEAIDVADPAPGPEKQAVAAGEARRIDDCLGQLDDVHAAAVRGAYMNGDSYEELAQRHHVPLNTMRSWLRRSLMKLKACLEPESLS